jgi:hypothetical protein
MLNCSFCHPDDPTSYLLYHLPSNVILPHLFHILTIGLATSETVAGYEASTFRHTSLLSGIVLAGLDIFFTTTYAPIIPVSTVAPAGLFWYARTLRFLTLLAFDCILALLIYTSATGRFYLFPALTPSTDPELSKRQTEQLLTQANLSLQSSATNLRAYSITRNAVVRNENLKQRDDQYWKDVVAMESEGGGIGDESVWEDEEVQRTIARVYGSGNVDVRTVRREAEGFVGMVTRGLDS